MIDHWLSVLPTRIVSLSKWPLISTQLLLFDTPDHYRSLFQCVSLSLLCPVDPAMDIKFTVTVFTLCLLFRDINPLPCHSIVTWWLISSSPWHQLKMDKKSRPSFQSIKITLNLDLITNWRRDFNHQTSILRDSSVTHHPVSLKRFNHSVLTLKSTILIMMVFIPSIRIFYSKINTKDCHKNASES